MKNVIIVMLNEHRHAFLPNGVHSRSLLYVKLRRYRDCTLLICPSVCYLPVRFRQLLRCAHKGIVDILKVYIKKNNMQVELIRFGKNVYFIHVYICESSDYVYSIFARCQHASPHCSKVNIMHQ